MISDDHVDRVAKNRPIIEAGSRGQENRSVLGVRCRCAATADGHVRFGGSLVGVHLVSKMVCSSKECRN